MNIKDMARYRHQEFLAEALRVQRAGEWENVKRLEALRRSASVVPAPAGHRRLAPDR